MSGVQALLAKKMAGVQMVKVKNHRQFLVLSSVIGIISVKGTILRKDLTYIMELFFIYLWPLRF
jgi:hypothetical protein